MRLDLWCYSNMTVPNIEPFSIRAGDTLTWSRSLADYPASGWTLSYVLINSSAKISITAGSDGNNHLVSVAPATSANYSAGWYDWTAQVTDGTDVYTVDYGRMEVLPQFSAASTLDNRTHARKMLEAIEAALEGKATNDQLDLLETSLATRGIKRDPEKLLIIRDRYRSEVANEVRADAIRKGLGNGRRIQTRLV